MSRFRFWNNMVIVFMAVLHFATLFMMSFKLGTEMHLFATFVTFISTLIFCDVGSHVRISVKFVCILVVTMVTMVPTAFGVGFHVSVKISDTFKLFVTTLYQAGQLIVNMNKHVLVQSALKWEAFSTKFAVKLQLAMAVTMFVK